MLDTERKDLFRRVIQLLVEQRYEALERLSNGCRLPADALRQSVSDYGTARLVLPAESAFDEIDEIEIEDGLDRRAWSVNFDLWTEDEHPSDLTLEMTIIENADGELSIELDGIHVL